MIDLVCVASGPSLKSQDCELVKKSNIKVLAVNNSWKMVPWCEYIYAGDYKWWNAYQKEVPETMEKWTCNKRASEQFGVNYHQANGPFNSGMRALLWAIEKDFKNIALLGFDCSVKNGTHWHGKHDEKGFSNPTTNKTNQWQHHFAKVYAKAGRKKVNIINCSRYTELGFFKTQLLEEVI